METNHVYDLYVCPCGRATRLYYRHTVFLSHNMKGTRYCVRVSLGYYYYYYLFVFYISFREQWMCDIFFRTCLFKTYIGTIYPYIFLSTTESHLHMHSVHTTRITNVYKFSQSTYYVQQRYKKNRFLVTRA